MRTAPSAPTERPDRDRGPSAAERRKGSLPPRTLLTIGLIVTALYVVGLFVAAVRSSYDVWGALVVGPVIVAITIPILSRLARRESDPKLFWVLLAAFALKLLASLARYWMVFYLYEKGDARVYDQVGAQIATRFLHGNFHTGIHAYNDTTTIELITGIIYAITRPTALGGFLVFAWIAFLGTLLFYRAYTIGLPTGRSRTYARLLFFMPSMLFWPASEGKEAWIIFMMGLIALGVAKLLTRGLGSGAIPLALGILGMLPVRAHFAGIVGLALLIAVVVRRPKRRGSVLAFVGKLALIAGCAVLEVYLLQKTTARLHQFGFTTGGGLNSILQQTVSSTEAGGSGFTPHLATTPSGFVLGSITVLFRPFITEAHNAQALAAALEGTFLALYTALRIPWIFNAARQIRRLPYITFTAATTLGFIVAMSAFGNFGILARERTTLYPFFFVLLSIAPLPKNEHDEEPAARTGLGGDHEPVGVMAGADGT